MPRRKIPVDPSVTPFKTEPKCHVCQCASRNKVDKLIASQWSYKSIAEELIMHDPDFQGKVLDTVRRNVERHSKNHLDLYDKGVRHIVERRAKEQGILLDEHIGQISTSRAFLDLVIQRGTEQISDPNSKVRYADVIEAAKMFEDAQKQEYQAQLELLQRQVAAISRAVKEVMPAASLPTLLDLTRFYFENPDFDGSGLKVLEQQPKPQEAIEAESVEEIHDER